MNTPTFIPHCTSTLRLALGATLVCAALGARGALAQENPAAGLPPTYGGTAVVATRVPFDLSSRLAEVRAKTDVPAIAAVMIDRNGVMARGVTGFRRAGGTTPVTLDDRWHLGSCTKAMTGTLCALLVADGTLQWDSTIDEVFNPARAEKAKITNNWKLVTVRQLTTCTANAPYDLGEYGGRPLWANLWEKARQGATPLEQRAYLFGELVKSNIGFPTTSFQYANASVALAGYMAETAAGTPYEDLIRTRLFTPLGISSAGFGAPGSPTVDDEPEDQPWGHSDKGVPVRPGINADNPASITPAGTAHMTIEDWGRFARLHLIGAEISLPHPLDLTAEEPEPEWDHQKTLGLGPADFAVLHAPSSRRNDYAAGWVVTNRAAWAKGTQPGATGRCLTHTGSNTYWTAAIWIAPEIDRAFLAVVNSGKEAVADDAREQALQAMIALDRQWRGLPPLKQ